MLYYLILGSSKYLQKFKLINIYQYNREIAELFNFEVDIPSNWANITEVK